MSSIPNAKMKHAHVHEGDDPGKAQPTPKAAKKDKADGASLGERARHLGERAQELAEDAVDAVKARPGTAAAIGAAVVAAGAAIFGGPAAARALRGDGDSKPAAKRPSAAKRPAAKKTAKPAKKD